MSNKANTRKDIFRAKKSRHSEKKQKRTKTLNKHNSNVYLVLLLCLNLMLHNIVLAQFETASILVNKDSKPCYSSYSSILCNKYWYIDILVNV